MHVLVYLAQPALDANGLKRLVNCENENKARHKKQSRKRKYSHTLHSHAHVQSLH